VTPRKWFALTSVSLAGACVFWLRAPAQNTSAGGDYLSAPLRQAVNRLKQEALETPTGESNAVARGRIVWDWLNAYSLTGGPIPVNATQQLGAVFALEAGENQPATRAQTQAFYRLIDSLIYEFRIKDERPGALPVLSLSSSGAFPAASFQTITQTVEIGKMPFRKGSSLLVGKQTMSDSGAFQNTDMKAENYISIRASKPDVRFAAISIPLAGMHGGFRGAANMPAFRIEEGSLETGDRVFLTYGDRTGGSPGLRMQTFASEDVLLPVYVDPEAKGVYLTPAWPSYRVAGLSTVAVRLIAPSVLRTGEEFELAIRGEDERLNRASTPLPGGELELNAEKLRGVPPASGALAVIGGLKIQKTGVYRLQYRSADGRLQGQSNPIWVEDNPARRIYWGETHAHTGMAEGQGSIDGFYRYGRDDARLDFLGLSEHDIWLDDHEWRAMQDAVRRYTAPDRFIAFLGYEWTSPRLTGGHHNVFFRDSGKQRQPVQKYWRLPLLYTALRTTYDPRDVLIIPHAHQAGDWRRNDPDMERLVEIMSMHGTFEWFGNYYLKRGHDVGFVAASDEHRSRPGLSGSAPTATLNQFGGLAAVIAPQKSSTAIFDALRNRSTYAVTNADRILLEVSVNGNQVGTRIPFSPQRRILARISGTSALDRLDVIKNGDIIYTKRFPSADLKPASKLQISFESDSEPYIRDNPRGYRTWRGVIEVLGARLAGATAAHLDNRYVEFIRQDQREPNRVHFLAATRGRADILEVNLENASPSTQVRVSLEDSVESGVSPVSLRPMARIPASSHQFELHELTEGLAMKRLPMGTHTDTITLQLIDSNAPMDYIFEYIDTALPQPGDYYYVRVSQRNGARAWSSPIWVGGEEAK
jgi:hypothetical protein